MVLLWSLTSLLLTGALLFLGFSWAGYKNSYPANELFRIGQTQLIEITLVREDARNLSCASDVEIGELRCGFDSAKRERAGLQERHKLSPYNSIKNELFLAAGLWSELGPARSLPRARFTVVCNFHVTSVLKSASLRWAPDGKFEPLERSVPVGFVSDCVVPP